MEEKEEYADTPVQAAKKRRLLAVAEERFGA